MKHLLFFAAFAMFSITMSAQNVGIGIPLPLAPLHVAGVSAEKLRLENTTALNTGISNELYFKTGSWFTGGLKTIGTGTAFARLGFFTYASNGANGLLERLSIADDGNVGIGVIAPTAKLEVNGNVKITDGTQGDGKVLTSDANGMASWRNTAYGDLERFHYFIEKNQFNEILGQIYNFGTASAIGNVGNPKKITVYINKPGLYHFDLNSYSQRPTATAGESVVHTVFFLTGEISRNLTYYAHDPVNNTLTTSYNLSFDLYISVPQQVQFRAAYLTSGPNDYYRISVTGHLIAD